MDIKTLESLADILAQSPANRLAVTGEDWSVELERPFGVAPVPAAGAAGAPALEQEAPSESPVPVTMDICAGVVGVFHSASPSPTIGQTVEPGAVLGTIESLAIRNEVRVETPGTVHAILVEDGQPVEYGQPLFLLTPLEA